MLIAHLRGFALAKLEAASAEVAVGVPLPVDVLIDDELGGIVHAQALELALQG